MSLKIISIVLFRFLAWLGEIIMDKIIFFDKLIMLKNLLANIRSLDSLGPS